MSRVLIGILSKLAGRWVDISSTPGDGAEV